MLAHTEKPLSAATIARGLGISGERTRRLLAEALRVGVIERVAHGWVLSEFARLSGRIQVEEEA